VDSDFKNHARLHDLALSAFPSPCLRVHADETLGSGALNGIAGIGWR
jgi:hypothetical protein